MAAVTSLGAIKAFDKVYWQFVFVTLEKFGFPQELIKWIRILYQPPKS